MRHLLGSAVVAMLATTAARAQLEPVQKLVAEAQQHAEAQRDEAAARLLCDASLILRAIKNADVREKRKLEVIVDRLLRQVDRDGLARVKLLDKSAMDLIRIADHYEKKGWLSTASVLYEQAQKIDPVRARDHLVRVREKLAVGPNDLLFERFQLASRVFGGGEWTRHDGWVASPALSDDGRNTSQAIVGWQNLEGDADIGVEIQISEGPGKAALMFGYSRAESTFYLLEIVHRPTHTSVYVKHYDGKSFQILHSFGGKLLPDVRAGYVPILVAVRGRDLEMTISDMLPFQIRVEEPVAGEVGLFVSGDTLNHLPVRFRHLRIQPR